MSNSRSSVSLHSHALWISLYALISEDAGGAALRNNTWTQWASSHRNADIHNAGKVESPHWYPCPVLPLSLSTLQSRQECHAHPAPWHKPHESPRKTQQLRDSSGHTYQRLPSPVPRPHYYSLCYLPTQEEQYTATDVLKIPHDTLSPINCHIHNCVQWYGTRSRTFVVNGSNLTIQHYTTHSQFHK